MKCKSGITKRALVVLRNWKTVTPKLSYISGNYAEGRIRKHGIEDKK